MKTLIILSCLVILAAVNQAECAKKRQKKVLLFLVDGLRWDYIEERRHHGFWTTGRLGVRADHLTPVTPTVSYPNWYSLVTGLYTEDHGIVGNYMYNPHRDAYFSMSSRGSMEPHWWNQAEPIWIKALRQNLTVAMHWWDGCQVDFDGTRPNICTGYKGTWSTVNTEMLDVVEKSLVDMKKGFLDFGMFYYEGPDSKGHAYGPDSPTARKTVDEFDRILDSVHAQLRRLDIENQVNIVIVSDHGMTKTRKEDLKMIYMDRLVNADDVHIMLDKGPFSMLVPKSGKVMEVYQSIKEKQVEGLRVYLKEEIPETWRLKKNRNVSPIVLMADVGYYIMPFSDPEKSLPGPGQSPAGSHGYDSSFPDMWGIFYASGPAILHSSRKVPALVMVDVYNVLCYMLGMVPRRNSGSWDRIESFVNPAYDPSLYDVLQKL